MSVRIEPVDIIEPLRRKSNINNASLDRKWQFDLRFLMKLFRKPRVGIATREVEVCICFCHFLRKSSFIFLS